jgi:hypothetical protein
VVEGARQALAEQPPVRGPQHPPPRGGGLDDLDVDRAAKAVDPVRAQPQPGAVVGVHLGGQEPPAQVTWIGERLPDPLRWMVEVDIEPDLRHAATIRR